MFQLSLKLLPLICWAKFPPLLPERCCGARIVFAGARSRLLMRHITVPLLRTLHLTAPPVSTLMQMNHFLRQAALRTSLGPMALTRWWQQSAEWQFDGRDDFVFILTFSSLVHCLYSIAEGQLSLHHSFSIFNLLFSLFYFPFFNLHLALSLSPLGAKHNFIIVIDQW